MKAEIKKKIYEAAERVALGIQPFSCNALEDVGLKHLVPQYRVFFSQPELEADWGRCFYYEDGKSLISNPKAKSQRILMLCLFAELG